MAALMLTPILIVLAVGLFYYPFRLGLELSVDGSLLPPLTAVSCQVQLKFLGLRAGFFRSVKTDTSSQRSFTSQVLVDTVRMFVHALARGS